MELVKPSIRYIQMTETSEVPLSVALMKKIERCGRIAYRSEDKITDDSYIRFISAIVSRKHYSVLEHARICLYIKRSLVSKDDAYTLTEYLNKQPFLSHNSSDSENPYFTITGNLRAFLEWLSGSLPYWFIFRYIKHYLAKQFPPVFGELVKNDTELKIKKTMFVLREADDYHTFHVVTDRGVMTEWTRHRYNMSFTVESTRYCNYQKRGMVFCLPTPFDFSPTEDDNEEKWIYNWLKSIGCITEKSKDGKCTSYVCCSDGISFEGHVDMCVMFAKMNIWKNHMAACERAYNELIERGCTPQAARSVLPNSLKSEFCVTGTDTAWDHFLELRCAKDAHPQIRYLADQVKELLFPAEVVVIGGEH